MDNRTCPAQRLERDIAAILGRYHRLLKDTHAGTDWHRLMVVISATYGAEQHLPRSLPRLLGQTRALGIAVDLLIGCNNGFESPALVGFLEQQSGCRVTHGFCTKVAPDQPAPVLDQTGAPLLITTGAPGEDRCFLIHQKCAPDAPAGTAAGKIRMLGDLYGWVERAIKTGWQPPQLLLACDAESEFDRLAPWSTGGYGEPGLGLLISRMKTNPNLQLLGTRNRFVVFETGKDGIRQPRPDWPVPSIQLYLNLVHARADGFMWLPGGGTLGRTEAMTALLATIAAYYPGARIEDVMTTVLAHATGLTIAHEPLVSSLNRCAPVSASGEAAGQIERFLSGQKDLVDKFGLLALKIVPRSNLNVIAAGFQLTIAETLKSSCLKRFVDTLFQATRILGALPGYLRVKRSAAHDTSDDPDFSAAW